MRQTMKKPHAFTVILASAALVLLAQPGSAADDAKSGAPGKPTGPDRIFQASEVTSTGSVTINGIALDSLNEDERAKVRNQLVGFVFQNFQLIPTLTAWENVMVPLELRGESGAKAKARDMLRCVGLEKRLHHYPAQLSGGEQQRVAIARALATGNPIMLADEPTGELDFTTGVQILRVLEEQARAGLSVLIVTHNREISRVADRVIELSSGRIVADGPPAGGRADLSELQW